MPGVLFCFHVEAHGRASTENANLLATSSPKNYNTRQLRRPVKCLSRILLRYEEFPIVVAEFFWAFLVSFVCILM